MIISTVFFRVSAAAPTVMTIAPSLTHTYGYQEYTCERVPPRVLCAWMMGPIYWKS